jgi:hypothetical protein
VDEQCRQTLSAVLEEEPFRFSIGSWPSRKPKLGLGWAGAEIIADIPERPAKDIDGSAIALCRAVRALRERLRLRLAAPPASPRGATPACRSSRGVA